MLSRTQVGELGKWWGGEWEGKREDMATKATKRGHGRSWVARTAIAVGIQLRKQLLAFLLPRGRVRYFLG